MTSEAVGCGHGCAADKIVPGFLGNNSAGLFAGWTRLRTAGEIGQRGALGVMPSLGLGGGHPPR